ncbi:diphosphomevalonate decarboxylase [Gangjinia marincola]|uniref:Diphosphomevalonate decarboxylase n=1 Tax=Gangjinia marincola TaxID=578463 RepID=A0ABN1MHY3_9FLAO
MVEKEFISASIKHTLEAGKFTWQAPSNIALVKYWGKEDIQIPKNASISFTLDHCATTTTFSFTPRDQAQNEIEFDIYFEGKKAENFKPKISTFFDRIVEYVPFIRNYSYTIDTSNSFPHSSGIASSASGMAALALGIMSIERKLNPGLTDDYFNKKASFLARLGSGSASRSIEGKLIMWGEHPRFIDSSDLYGIKAPIEVAPLFNTYHDCILLVDKGQKQVSSSVGHGLMHDHPFAASRFRQAEEHLTRLAKVLSTGDVEQFIQIVESEALSLHAMMMSSQPYFILMRPHTLEVIQKIWQFRKDTGSSVCFTLDAGANVHVLFPDNEQEQVYEFIKNELVGYCENGQYIRDKVGNGAKMR